MAELAKKYGLSDESRVRDWLKSYNGHRKFKRHSAARGALYMTKGKKTTQQECAEIVAFCLGCILPTPNAPGQRAFSRRAASFFLEIRQYSCKKMSCAAQKFFPGGHIFSFQIHPKSYRKTLFNINYYRLSGSLFDFRDDSISA